MFIILLTILILAGIFVPIVLLGNNKFIDLLNPACLFTILFVSMYGGRYLYLQFWPEILSEVGISQNQGEYVNLAMIVSVIAIIFFWIGYMMPIGRAFSKAIPSLPSSWSKARSGIWVGIAYFLGVSLHLYEIFIAAGGFTEWLHTSKDALLLSMHIGGVYLKVLSYTLPMIAIIGSFIRYRYAPSRFRLSLVLIFLSTEILYSFMTGSRGGWLYIVVGLGLTEYYIRGGAHSFGSVKVVLSGLLVTIIMAVLFPIISIIRFVGLEALINNFWVTLSSINYSFSSVFAEVFRRFYMLDTLAWAIKNIPNHFDYSYGTEIYYSPLAIIPRVIWEGKPILGTPKISGDQMVPLLSTDYIAKDMHTLTELYWIGGVGAVILGMVVIGVLFRVMREYMRLHGESSSIALFIGVSYIGMVTILNSAIPDMLTSYAFQVIIVLLFSILLKGKKSRLIKH